jgi:hypothetical protein
MCFYSHTRKVTLPSMLVQTVDGKKSDERAAADAAKKLAGDIEFDLFRGKADFSNAGVFDGNMGAIPGLPNLLGVDAQIRQSDLMRNAQDLMFNEYGSEESVVIAGGSTLTQENIEDGWTRSQMNHGQASRLCVDPKVLSNYNKIAFAKERIVLAGSSQDSTGADPVPPVGQRRRREARGLAVPQRQDRPGAVASDRPGDPTVTSALPATISGVTTGFLNGQVYKYTVTACNEVGESPRSAVATGTLDADGKGVNVLISHSGLSNVRHFNVYRSAAGGSVMKFIGRVALAVGAPRTPRSWTSGNKQPGFVTGFLIETTR